MFLFFSGVGGVPVNGVLEMRMDARCHVGCWFKGLCSDGSVALYVDLLPMIAGVELTDAESYLEEDDPGRVAG